MCESIHVCKKVWAPSHLRVLKGKLGIEGNGFVSSKIIDWVLYQLAIELILLRKNNKKIVSMLQYIEIQ